MDAKSCPGECGGGDISAAAPSEAGAGDGFTAFYPLGTRVKSLKHSPWVLVTHFDSCQVQTQGTYVFSHSVWSLTFMIRREKSQGTELRPCKQVWAIIWIWCWGPESELDRGTMVSLL